MPVITLLDYTAVANWIKVMLIQLFGRSYTGETLLIVTHIWLNPKKLAYLQKQLSSSRR